MHRCRRYCSKPRLLSRGGWGRWRPKKVVECIKVSLFRCFDLLNEFVIWVRDDRQQCMFEGLIEFVIDGSLRSMNASMSVFVDALTCSLSSWCEFVLSDRDDWQQYRTDWVRDKWLIADSECINVSLYGCVSLCVEFVIWVRGDWQQRMYKGLIEFVIDGSLRSLSASMSVFLDALTCSLSLWYKFVKTDCDACMQNCLRSWKMARWGRWVHWFHAS